jgi:hypothetical protein
VSSFWFIVEQEIGEHTGADVSLDLFFAAKKLKVVWSTLTGWLARRVLEFEPGLIGYRMLS